MSRRARRLLAGSLLAVAAAVVAAPFLRADRFAPRIRAGVQAAFGRDVDIHGNTALLLFPRPGFRAAGVVIHEQPPFGAEPFAYVPALEATLSFSGLLRGRLEFASIRLLEPSVNLMQREQSGWNFQPMLDLALGRAAASASLPDIEIQGGRINVKFGDMKSVLYLADADLALETDTGDPGRLGIRFSGEPARTDRATRAWGRVSGRGWLRMDGQQESQVLLNVAVQRASVAEILTLLQGRSTGLGGLVSSRARLSGPLSAVDIDGRIELDEFERWSWLLPSASGWGWNVRGTLDLRGQSVQLETRTPGKENLPVSVRLRASDLLRRPNWAALLTLRDLPLASLRSLALETGLAFPAGLPLEGILAGSLSFSPPGGVQGQLTVRDASLTLPGVAAVTVPEASLVVQGSQYRLLPAALRIGPEEQAARLEAAYDMATGAVDVRIQTAAVDTDDFRSLWRQVAAASPGPLFDLCRGGNWRGWLRYAQPSGREGGWGGEILLRDSRCRVDGLAAPVTLAAASARLKGESVELARMEGDLDGILFTGDYSFDAARRRPHLLRIEVAEANAAALESLLEPALRRTQGILDRTLRRAARLPEWLRARHAEVRLRIGSLEAAGYRLGSVVAHAYWDGARIELRDLGAVAADGRISGAALVLLDRRDPVFQAQVSVENFAWREGRIDADLDLETSGGGLALLANLRAGGAFQARNLVLVPPEEWLEAGGCFSFGAPPGGPRLLLSGLHATIGQESFQGQGSAGADGRLAIELASAQKQLRLAGRLNGFQLDLLAQEDSRRR